MIERASGKRVNSPGSVSIGDHVWVGLGAIISKGSSVPADSIVGAMSFVNGKFDEEGTVIAGVPAKVIKRGVTWSRVRKKRFSPEEMDGWKS
ncbi:hypothetical protein ATB98_02195 [Sinorhizobium saheli]|uniref:Acetyltransferase n=1 Tax=Sinorhizobium saheli TaxID=36856 RepID=A0A178XYF5_SINSA|nr:hypothetical protein ATB98_02195 [Sinorhizobium saheli]